MKWACTQWLDAGVSLFSCVYVHSPTLPQRTGRDVSGSLWCCSARRGVEPLTTGSRRAECLWCHSSDPNIRGTVTSPGCVHWVLRNPNVGVSGLMLLFPYVGGWLFSVFFSFVPQILGASGTLVIVRFKAFVSLSFMLHCDIECVSNEWKASIKAHHNSMLVFLWDHFGVSFNRLMSTRSQQRALHMTEY